MPMFGADGINDLGGGGAALCANAALASQKAWQQGMVDGTSRVGTSFRCLISSIESSNSRLSSIFLRH